MVPYFRYDIEVFCPHYNVLYPGTVSSINDDFMFTISYDDGYKETLNLYTESCRLRDSALTENSVSTSAHQLCSTDQVVLT